MFPPSLKIREEPGGPKLENHHNSCKFSFYWSARRRLQPLRLEEVEGEQEKEQEEQEGLTVFHDSVSRRWPAATGCLLVRRTVLLAHSFFLTQPSDDINRGCSIHEAAAAAATFVT